MGINCGADFIQPMSMKRLQEMVERRKLGRERERLKSRISPALTLGRKGSDRPFGKNFEVTALKRILFL